MLALPQTRRLSDNYLFGSDAGSCQAALLPDNAFSPCWEKPVQSGAEGATAPETLRQKDHKASTALWREARFQSGPRRRDNNLRHKDRGGS